MRLLPLLCALSLLLPAAAFADEDDDTPPWDVPEGDDDDDDDDDAPEEAAPAEEEEEEAEEEYSEPAPSTSSDEFKSGSPVGLGFAAGTLNGFSLKIWPAQSHGIIFNVGVPNLLNSVGMHVGYRFHLPKITPRAVPLHFHLYIGGNFRTRLVFYNNGTYVEIGGGVAIGASLTVTDAPVEFWAEVVPSGVGAVVPANVGIGFDVDGLVGVRFFPG
jgi:hypothetical protein